MTNLPPKTYRNLVGRQPAIQAITSRLNASAPGMVTVLPIYGPSGVGKTSLVLEIGNYYVDNYLSLPEQTRFEAIIWISAQPTMLTADGFETSAFLSRDIQDVVATIAVTLGRMDILQAVRDNQLLLAYDALAKQRTLLILDNAETILDRRVFGFLRQVPPTTSIIVTSRTQQDLGLATPVRISPLDKPSGLQLVRELSTTKKVTLTDAEQTRLLELTGGIPLGIVWSIALLAYGDNASVIFRSLEASGSDILRFCFDRAWEVIQGTAAQNVLFALTLFSADINQQAVAYVAGLETDNSGLAAALALLDRLSLIDKSGERLNALPMTKAYTIAHLAQHADLERHLRSRWAEYLFLYVRRALQAQSWSDAFDDTDKERPNIFGLFSWISTRQGDSLRFGAAVTFHDATYYLYSRGYWSYLLSHSDWVIRSLYDQGLIEEMLIVLLSWVARVHLYQSDNAKVSKCFEQAAELLAALDARDVLYDAIVAFDRASILRRQERDADALNDLHTAIDVFHRLGRADLEAAALNRLGNTLAKLHRYSEAQAAYEAVVQIAQATSSALWAKELLGDGLGNLGILANRVGDYDRAIRMLNESLARLAQLLDRAVALMELAIAHYKTRRFRKAVRFAISAQELVAELNLAGSIAESDPSWEVRTLPKLKQRWFRPLLWLFTP